MKKKLFLIDLFCGAGGVTSGFAKAKGWKVIAAVNHDPIAIASHLSNHKGVKHFTEDIRTLDLRGLIKIVERCRIKYPDCIIALWASLECTNFSKAKGGLPRDGDSRTLADHLFRYIEMLKPDYIYIENVEEFMSWGPLDDKGKPISRRNGSDYVKWCNEVQGYGYSFYHRILNSANYGAYTSRKRFFGIFAAPGFPIVFPLETHAKHPQKEGMLGDLQKWKPVREVLDLEDVGNSIFGRKKGLREKTLARIHAGLIKYIAGGKEAFLLKYNSVNGSTGKHVCPGIDEPCPTVSTQNRIGIVAPIFVLQRNSGTPESKVSSIEQPARTLTSTGGNLHLVESTFISKYFSGKPEGKNISINGPAGTIKTKDSQSLISAAFISKYHGNGDNVHSVDGPAPALPTHDSCAIINTQFIDKNYSGKDNHQSIDAPAGTIVGNDKHVLVSTSFLMNTNFNNVGSSLEHPSPVITANRKYHYLINPQWNVNSGASVDKPCPTLIARQDKSPLYLVETEEGYLAIEVFESDSEFTVRIKEFMALYGIVDIKMRMLRIPELLRIQGFGDDYTLRGTQADQKRFIGNSVEVTQAQKLAEALGERLNGRKEG